LSSVYIKSGSTYTTIGSQAASGVTATSNGSSVYLTAKVTGTYLGSFSYSAIYSNVNATALFFWDNSSTTPKNKWPKAVWNYALINNDASFGIHNPSFVSSVIDNTIGALSDTTN
jgi:hypothetical protein